MKNVNWVYEYLIDLLKEKFDIKNKQDYQSGKEGEGYIWNL